jgi:hypothetical protein
VTLATKSVIAFLAGPSFHDGNASACADASRAEIGIATAAVETNNAERTARLST